MTQPSTSDTHLPSADLKKAVGGTVSEGNAEQSSILPDTTQPAIVHPNFDPSRLALDPARPLSDIPEPANCFRSIGRASVITAGSRACRVSRQLLSQSQRATIIIIIKWYDFARHGRYSAGASCLSKTASLRFCTEWLFCKYRYER